MVKVHLFWGPPVSFSIAMRTSIGLISLMLLFLTGCIGTDLVDEPLGQDRSALRIQPRNLSLLIGETSRLTAYALDFDGDTSEVTLFWRSASPSIVSVTSAGEVSALTSGQAHVFVESADGKRDSTLITVVVDANAVATVEIEGDDSPFTVGETRSFRAIARNQTGDSLSGSPVSWRSSNPSVITVDMNGQVEAIANGNIQLVATVDGINSLPVDLQVGSSSRQGTFTGQSGYSVSGTVTLNQGLEGLELVFGSDFQSQSGPGLYVYLGQNANNGTGAVEIAPLESTQGAQSYVLPDNLDPDNFGFVLVYCKPFGLVFGSAEW